MPAKRRVLASVIIPEPSGNLLSISSKCARRAAEEREVNKFEAMKAAKDGLDVWPDLLRHAAERTPTEEIPAEDLDRMKWYGVFHRRQTPGFFMLRLRIPGG